MVFFEVFQARKTDTQGLKNSKPHVYNMKVCCYHIYLINGRDGVELL